MTIQEYIEKHKGKNLLDTIGKLVPPKPKTQVEYIVEAIENFNISMLEVILDEKNTYTIIVDNEIKSDSKKEFIDFLNHNFKDLKKKHVKQLVSFKMSDENDFCISMGFDAYFDFKPDFSLIGLDILDDYEPFYYFFIDIYFDSNKNVTKIVFSDQP